MYVNPAGLFISDLQLAFPGGWVRFPPVRRQESVYGDRRGGDG